MKRFTDAEFEVVSGPLRVGDPHPSEPGWRYMGPDASGRPLWRKPPALNRAQMAAVLIAGAIALQAGVYVVAEALNHHWPR